MARCEQCGNDYDKSFEVTMGGRTIDFDSSNARSRRSRPPAPIAAAASSGIGSSTTALSSAASIAPRRKASRVSAIGIDRRPSGLMPTGCSRPCMMSWPMATSRVFGV